jgi:hypothetical protein
MSSALSISSLAPPPSLRSSPFSSLPNELIQAIFENAVPDHYRKDTYSARQSTLRSLCLVSKLFHQIAEPLLFEVVHLPDRAALKLWQSRVGGMESIARAILIGNFRNERIHGTLSNFESLVRLCRNLTTISLNACLGSKFDISRLWSAPREYFPRQP